MAREKADLACRVAPVVVPMTALWWQTGVIYQIYPRSFWDLNGDGIGDLAGITAELPRLAELDVDAVWLSPFYRSPQRDAGYDVSDYCDVDPLFGTLDDFAAMMAEAAISLGILSSSPLSPPQWPRLTSVPSSRAAFIQPATAEAIAMAGAPSRGNRRSAVDMFTRTETAAKYIGVLVSSRAK